MKLSHLGIIGGLLLLFVSRASFGQAILDDTNRPPQSTSIWRNGIGNGFNADTYSVGFLTGVGLGTRVLGSIENHDVALANINAAWFFPEILTNTRVAGNLEFRGELFAGSQFSPQRRYFTGMTLLPRYDFAIGSRFVPFAGIGAGLTGTDIGPPDIGELFNFNVQVDVGTYYFLRKNFALTAEYRWFHISDAGITKVNQGVNTQMMEGGLAWFF